MGSSSQTQTTRAQSTTEPWARAIPLLGGILDRLQGQLGGVNITGNERRALAQLTANAQRGNPYASGIGMLAGDLLRGGPDRTGMANAAYARLQSQLNPFARGDYVNPNSNPALQGYLSTIANDVQGRVNAMFAGAGRDLSGANLNALARGISEGQAPVLAQAYENERDRQLGAIQGLYSGGTQTAGLLSNLDQQRFNTRLAGINASQAALQAQDSPAMRLLQIEAMRRGIPLQQLGMLSSMAVPIAQLGGTNNTTSTTTAQMQQPLAQQILGGAIGGLGLLGGLGGFGQQGWLYSTGQNPTGLLNRLLA